MRARLIKQKTIERFIINNASSRIAFKLFVMKLKSSDWKTPADILITFPSADILGNGSNRVVFNIAGNGYRMICAYYFGTQMVHLFVKWIGTHAEYDKICKKNEQYIVSIN